MATPFIGEIVMFGGTFAPRQWAFCSGAIMSIAQNSALFSILGTTYGGNGTQTFALPDLRSRVPVHAGQGNGLSPYVLGQVSGAQSVTLTVQQMPAHNHPVTVTSNANSGAATDTLPNNNFLAADNQYAGTSNAQLNATAVQVTLGIAGGSQPVSILPPSLAVNFIIAIEGVYPSRN